MLDTVIIGAGFAGLAAAKRLIDLGNDNFTVLEARDRVGGRTKHGQIAGIDIDLGGMWLAPSQTRLAHWADYYGVQTYPTPIDGKTVFRISGKEHLGEREDIDGLFNLLDGLNYTIVDRKLRKLVASIDREQPWNHPQSKELDAITLEQWICKHLRSEQLRQTFRMICFSLCCCEASQVSMLFFVMYLKSGDGLEDMISSDNGGTQNLLFTGGVHQIARKLASEVKSRLQLDTPARRIEWHSDGAVVHTSDSSIETRKVIISVPPTLLEKIEFSPALPLPKRTLHRKLSMGSCIKYWVAYERPFWRDKGFSGGVFRDDAPCSPCFEVTPPNSSKGIIAGFFDGNHAINYSAEGTAIRRKHVVSMLAEHFGDDALNPIEYLDEDWTTSEWSNGCYGAYAPPGIYADYGAWLRKAIGPLHWAGTETSARWTGYIDGAIRSGELAAEATANLR